MRTVTFGLILLRSGCSGIEAMYFSRSGISFSTSTFPVRQSVNSAGFL